MYFGNTVREYTIAIAIFIGLWITLKLFQAVVVVKLRRLAKTTTTDIDDTFIEIVSSIKPAFYFFISIWGGLKFLDLAELVYQIVGVVLVMILTYQIIFSLQILINYVVNKGFKDEGSKSAARLIGKLLKGVLWAIGILMILSNLGINVTSLVAGMGIGGIAIALAIQNVLGDLFSSLTIHLDRPFVVGDYIVVGADDGVVEKIGIKTTRLRSLQGEEIVISNQELTSARVHNLRKMKDRRVVLNIGVTYETNKEKMNDIPKMFEAIVSNIKRVRFGRAHFKKFEDSSLLFEFVYYIDDRDYDLFMNINQQIQLELKSKFEEKQIEFAYPSQTIYLQK